MKHNYLLMSGLIPIFLIGGVVYGQNIPIPIDVISPFSKGNSFSELSNNLSIDWNKLKNNDQDAGKRNNFGMMVKGTYFLIDGVGVGAGIDLDRTKEIDGDIEILNSSTIGSLNVMYGRSLSSVLNLYGKAEVRAGVNKYKYQSNLFNQDNKHNEFGLNFEVGAPFTLGNENGFYVTPYMAYDYNTVKDDDWKDTYAGLYLGTRLNMSLPCASFAHDCDQVRDFSDNMYTQGTNVIGGHSRFRINMGTEKYEYIGGNGNGFNDENYSTSGGSLKVEYYRYVVDNVAVGGDFRLMSDKYKSKEDNFEENYFSWMLSPKVQVQVPVTGDLNNLFGFVGFGVGKSKEKFIEEGEPDEEFTDNKSSFTIGAGYNLFFAKSFALVPTISYQNSTTVETDNNDLKRKRSGIEFGFSIRHSF